MVEKVVRDRKDILELIEQAKKIKNTNSNQIEKAIGLGSGNLCRWNNSSPNIDNVLKVLQFLDLEIVVRTKHEEMEEMDVTYMDSLIQNSILKILKNSDITLSDKERLYRILHAFL